MTTRREQGYRQGLVDMKAGQISREIFVNDEIYQQELERLFARVWLFVGHESQIPNPGDFFVSGMGEESVILCRDRAGKVHVFLNSCRHRGMKVCRYDEGNTPVFTCPYHGWSYGTDGRLVGVPYFREAYHEKLDKSQWGLVEVPQLCCYKGTVWACWDPEAPSFFEYLGDFVRYLDLTLDGWDGSEGGTEILGGIQKWRIPCNWKFPAENFCGDSYHNISHRSVDLVGIGPSGSGRRDMQERLMARRLQVSFYERGHQTGVYLFPKDRPVAAFVSALPDSLRIFRPLRGGAAQEARRVGAAHRQPRRNFPQYGIAPAPAPHDRGLASPRDAPDRGVALVSGRQGRTLRGQGFPARLLHPLLRPGGMTEQDDMENWNYAHAASRGTIARRYPYSYEQGLGYEVENYEFEGLRIPGTVMDITEAKSSEHNLRNLYRRWAEFMEAESWNELATWRRNGEAMAAE